MKDDDEKVIEKFFDDNKLDIADDGFVERVMRKLPDSRLWWVDKVWTLLCMTAIIVWFVVKDGVAMLCDSLSAISEYHIPLPQYDFDTYMQIIVAVFAAMVYAGVSAGSKLLKSDKFL